MPDSGHQVNRLISSKASLRGRAPTLKKARFIFQDRPPRPFQGSRLDISEGPQLVQAQAAAQPCGKPPNSKPRLNVNQIPRRWPREGRAPPTRSCNAVQTNARRRLLVLEFQSAISGQRRAAVESAQNQPSFYSGSLPRSTGIAGQRPSLQVGALVNHEQLSRDTVSTVIIKVFFFTLAEQEYLGLQ